MIDYPITSNVDPYSQHNHSEMEYHYFDMGDDDSMRVEDTFYDEATGIELFECLPAPPKELVNLTVTGVRKFAHLSNGYLALVLVLFGIVTNGLTLAALHTHVNPRPSMFKYLYALSIWDILVLGTTLLLHAAPNVIWGGTMLARPLYPIYPLLLFLTTFSQIGNSWTLVILAVMRYYSLRYPLRTRTASMKLNLYRILFMTTMIAGIYSWPRFFEVQSIPACIEVKTGNVQYVLQRTSLRSNEYYYVLHRLCGGLLLYSLLPYFFILTLSIAISRALRADDSMMGKENSMQSGDYCNKAEHRNKLIESSNRILWLVIMKYLATHSLTTVIDVLELTFGMGNPRFLENDLITCLVTINNLLVVANSATNFWVYYLTSSLFRRGLQRVIFQCQWRQETNTIVSAGFQIQMLASLHAQGMINYECRRSRQYSHARSLIDTHRQRSLADLAGNPLRPPLARHVSVDSPGLTMPSRNNVRCLGLKNTDFQSSSPSNKKRPNDLSSTRVSSIDGDSRDRQSFLRKKVLPPIIPTLEEEDELKAIVV